MSMVIARDITPGTMVRLVNRDWLVADIEHYEWLSPGLKPWMILNLSSTIEDQLPRLDFMLHVDDVVQLSSLEASVSFSGRLEDA